MGGGGISFDFTPQSAENGPRWAKTTQDFAGGTGFAPDASLRLASGLAKFWPPALGASVGSGMARLDESSGQRLRVKIAEEFTCTAAETLS
jgi:hypothetical protein